jgi:hypothetical protein
MTDWYQIKLLIEHATGVSMDALHILAGVLAQLMFAALFRSSLHSWRPWLFVLALILLNETSDLWVERWPEPAMQYGEGLKDLLLTMLLPTLLTLLARHAPTLLGGRSATDDKKPKI